MVGKHRGRGEGGDFRVRQHKLGEIAESARRCQFSDPTPQQEATQTRCCMKLLVMGKDGRQMHATALMDTGKQLQRAVCPWARTQHLRGVPILLTHCMSQASRMTCCSRSTWPRGSALSMMAPSLQLSVLDAQH